MASVQLTVNGQARQLEIDPRQSLLTARAAVMASSRCCTVRC